MFGGRYLADRVRDMAFDLTLGFRRGSLSGFQRHECGGDQPLNRIGHSDHSSLGGDSGFHNGAFHFHRTEAMSRNVDDVIDATYDPKVTIVVFNSSIVCEI